MVGGVVCIAATDGACAIVVATSLTSAEGATVAAGACLSSACGVLLGAGAFGLFGSPGDPSLDPAAGLGGDGAATDSATAQLANATCGGESFSPDTKVLTADGSQVAIAALAKGQKILAGNTATGKSETEPVAAVLVHHDTNLYDLTVSDGHGTSVIRTTADHLLWLPAKHAWIKAGDLHEGDRLQTPDGTTDLVLGGTPADIPTGWMWDLTIPTDHDFYVVADSIAVLVHNDDCGGSTWTPDENYSPDAVNARSTANQAYYGTPQEVHNTVSAIESGSLSQRFSGGLPDSYQVRGSTPRGYRRWGGATVYTGVGGPGTLTRVLVNSDGSVGYILGHNYNQVFQYPWANLPGAYTGQ